MRSKLSESYHSDYFYFVLGFFILIVGIFTSVGILVHRENKAKCEAEHASYCIYYEMNELKYDAVKYELVTATDEYIKSVAPLSALNGISVIDKCIEYNIDPIFVLAQGQIESSFGTKGLARKTNSVWNAYAFDGHSYSQISSKGKYRSPDDSIDAFLRILTKNYLGDSKTEYDLMNEYVNLDGNRYASAKDYEAKLVKVYDSIKTGTKIDSLNYELKRLRIILNK